MRKLTIIVLALLVFPSFASANLIGTPGPFDAREAPQGSTVPILIPAHGLTNIKGTFDSAATYFYKITKEPGFDEPISRAEFLEEMFLNSNFGYVETTTSTSTDTITSTSTTSTSDTLQFSDVPPSHPYYETVQKAASLGIVHGYEDGLFRPYTSITRGQIAKVLVEAFDPEPTLDEPPIFTDIPQNHRFYDYINQATQSEIYKGYPDGYMRPDRPINFSEAKLVIERAAKPPTFNFLPPRTYYRGYLGIHRLSQPGTKDLQLLLTRENNQNEQKTIPINIIPRDFPTISFSLSKDKTDLFATDDIDKTWKMINEAKKSPTSNQLWQGRFQMPTIGELTLGFGDKLYINGTYSGSHFGLDLANSEGTEIFAPNNGIVTLAGDTPSYGKVIVIDHGHNIFTMYLHNSELKVAKDQYVKKGDLITLMGSTGIATGPHLHYTNFVGDIIVDSQEWLDKEF